MTDLIKAIEYAQTKAILKKKTMYIVCRIEIDKTYYTACIENHLYYFIDKGCSPLVKITAEGIIQKIETEE